MDIICLISSSTAFNSFVTDVEYWYIAILGLYGVVKIIKAGRNSDNVEKMLTEVVAAAVFVSAIPIIKFLVNAFK